MSHAALIFQAATAVIALIAAGFAWRLDRRLARMRRGQDGMTRLVGELAEATARAERSVRELRAAGDEAGTELSETIAKAREAAEELRLLTPGGRRAPARRASPRAADEARDFADILKTTR